MAKASTSDLSEVVVNLKQSYFELFGLPETWQVDTALMSVNYRRLQQEQHPDRFAAASAQERRVAVQCASFINEAYTALSSPLQRGIYLLGRRGIVVEMENNTLMDPVFLMQQMELREALAEINSAADPEAELDRFRSQLDRLVAQFKQQFADAWATQEPATLEAAADILRKMQFLLRLDEEAERLEARILDEL